MITNQNVKIKKKHYISINESSVELKTYIKYNTVAVQKRNTSVEHRNHDYIEEKAYHIVSIWYLVWFGFFV